METLEKINDCPHCDGTGYIEKMSSHCGDDTGYNIVFEGTGEYVRCPQCNAPDEERDED